MVYKCSSIPWASDKLPSSLPQSIFLLCVAICIFQGQANRYIKNMGKDPSFSLNGIDVIKLTDKNFLRTLENGIRFGKWVLLENVQVK